MVCQMKHLFEPLFQPIADDHGAVFAFEALMRLRGYHDGCPLGMVRRWESSGYIRIADFAMLRSVVDTIAKAGQRPGVAVNVSIITVETDADAYLMELVQLAAQARRLIVELTETAPVRDTAAVIRFAAACKANGFHVALDDCQPGHPYCSVSFIRSVRPTLIKIDGGFLRRSLVTGEAQALRQLIDTAHRYRARVIAEHVADEILRTFAFDLGADFVQGYAVGEPAPLTSGLRKKVA